jgi:Uma2 family endonuclease
VVAKRARKPEPEVALQRRRFSADEYERMIETGILRDDERLELWEGDILCMSPVGKRHQARVTWLNDHFASATHGRAIVWVQGSFRMHDGAEPQPDLLLLRYRDDFYESALPEPADVLLLVEVADTSLVHDRDEKLPRYAAAGIIEVWIEDLSGDRLLAYREPRGGRYR